MTYAGFWVRFGAYIIDAILIFIVLYLIQTLTGINMGLSYSANVGDLTAAGGNQSAGTTGSLINLAIGLAYFAGMESSSHQGTLGKKALGLVVTDLSGNRITFMRALGRYFGKILSAIILLIGFIMVAFTEKKQGLHDMLASTLVLKGQPATAATFQ